MPGKERRINVSYVRGRYINQAHALQHQQLVLIVVRKDILLGHRYARKRNPKMVKNQMQDNANLKRISLQLGKWRMKKKQNLIRLEEW